MDPQVHRIIILTEDVAVGLRQFRDQLPQNAADITKVFSEFYAISATLRSLEGLARQFPRHYVPIRSDFDQTLTSLRFTLNQIINSFEKVDRRSTADDFLQIWLDLNDYFTEESGHPLTIRLQQYREFLQGLEDIVQNKRVDLTWVSNRRRAILKILEEQDGRFSSRFAGLSIGRPESSMSNSSFSGASLEGHADGIRKRRSYERARPGFQTHPSPLHSPTSTNDDSLPWAPEAPTSPTSTTATTQSNLSSAILNDHWAKNVFPYRGPVTKFPIVGERSKCLGKDNEDIKDLLHEQGFDEIAYWPFHEEDSSLSVYFYIREDDNRTRIMCKSRRGRTSKYYCLPLNMLEIQRVGPCLQLCRRRHSGTQLIPWLNLHFTYIEEMTIFFCTFLALRSQDGQRHIQGVRDYELDAEKEYFGGLIEDDSFIHALRIYRDRISGGIRLQASIHEGEMKRAPVWTAFINHYIDSRNWLRRVNNRVLLRDMRQVIFFPEYTPPRNSRGEYILIFTSETDARDFVVAIERLKLID